MLVESGDPTKDAAERKKFLDAYAAKHALVPATNGAMTLDVGDDDWPLPIPLVQANGAWHFDARDGAQEIVDRRIGRNEIAAIRVCLAYVDAQRAFFDMMKEQNGQGAYAQKLLSTPGQYDGLYWPMEGGAPESPLEPLVETAKDEGYPGQIEAGQRKPYQGYYYRILTAQGVNAPGGPRNYLKGGSMTGGFALVAWPAIFGASGVMTFIVDQDGVVFQKDLGSDTAGIASRMQSFDPDLSWSRVDIAD